MVIELFKIKYFLCNRINKDEYKLDGQWKVPESCLREFFGQSPHQ